MKSRFCTICKGEIPRGEVHFLLPPAFEPCCRKCYTELERRRKAQPKDDRKPPETE